MTIGEKIKKYRTEKNLTQKQLAAMAGFSESAIRNYERRNRTPSEKHISSIAGALGIHPFAISDPNLESYLGVMHTLFELEENWGASVVAESGTAYITFPVGSDSRSRLSDKEWKSTYPESVIINKNRVILK